MKKIFTLITLCILASFLITSCQSNYSLLKRHYNTGYYVAHKSDVHSPVSSVPNETVQVKRSDRIVGSGRVEIKSVTETVQAIPLNPEASSLRKSVISETKVKSTGITQSSQRGLLPATKILQFVPISSPGLKSRMEGSDRSGLSLFWLIILIILILWVLGFLAGGFGLGGLINLLLLIALILFILWLLRVV